MGVIPPLCESGEIIEDPFIIRMKDMGAKLMYENSALTEKIISISTYMAAHLKDQHFFTCSFCQFTRYNCACHAATNDKTIIYLSLIHISEPTRLGMISYAVFCLKKKTNKRRKLRV